MAEVIALIVGLAFQDSRGLAIPPMAPVQILFLNMITSSPPAIALGMDPATPKLMKQPPRPASQLLPMEYILDTIIIGTLMGCLILATFVINIFVFGPGQLDSKCNVYNESTFSECRYIFAARGCAFVTGTWLALFHAFTCRQPREPIWFDSWAALRGNKILWYAVGFGLVAPIPTL